MLICLQGHYGSGKTMIAVEAFKIMVAKAKLAGFDMEMHTLVYDEKLNQLKHDLEMKWLFQHDGANVTDLKKYLDEFAKLNQINPEGKSLLEDFHSTKDDFRETMTFLARKLNDSYKVHIILMDEVELKNVTSIISENDATYADVDLSYVAEFENVKFIICLRPMIEGCKNFDIKYSKKRPNQYIKHLKNRYRNCKEIYELLCYWQQNDLQSDGFPILSSTENLNMDWLPPSLNGGVIWIPMIPLVEGDVLNEIYFIIDTLQDRNSISILYHKEQITTRDIAMKIKNKRNTLSGPHEHLTFNGGESDVVVYICESGLNLQTMARAKKLLIILTMENDWNNTFPLLKDAIFKQNLGKMIRFKGCFYDIMSCCDSDYEDQAVLKHLRHKHKKKPNIIDHQMKYLVSIPSSKLSSIFGYCDYDQIVSKVLSSKSKLSKLLLEAVKERNEENVSILLNVGANQSARDRCSYNCTSLHYCASKGFLEIAKLLLIHDHSMVNAFDSDNNTPLHDAALFGHLEVARTLLEYGASVDIKNVHGDTPLKLAKGSVQTFLSYSQQGEMINLLKSYTT